MSAFRWYHAILIAILAIGIYYYLNIQAPYISALRNPQGLEIIGEVDVESYPDLADEYLKELDRLLGKTSAWVKENIQSKHRSLTVENTNVRGPLRAAGMPMQRGIWTVDNCSSGELYQFLISPEGFRVIDPVRSLRFSLFPHSFIPLRCRFLQLKSIEGLLSLASLFRRIGNQRGCLRSATPSSLSR